jgi:hypothetical protein
MCSLPACQVHVFELLCIAVLSGVQPRVGIVETSLIDGTLCREF